MVIISIFNVPTLPLVTQNWKQDDHHFVMNTKWPELINWWKKIICDRFIQNQRECCHYNSIRNNITKDIFLPVSTDNLALPYIFLYVCMYVCVCIWHYSMLLIPVFFWVQCGTSAVSSPHPDTDRQTDTHIQGVALISLCMPQISRCLSSWHNLWVGWEHTSKQTHTGVLAERRFWGSEAICRCTFLERDG